MRCCICMSAKSVVVFTHLKCLLFFDSGLVPLHNACSYGHYEVAELLVRHGASVNVADLWKFTPLHEAAAKGNKIQMLLCLMTIFNNIHLRALCALLLAHGADPTMKNQEGQTPLDLATVTEVVLLNTNGKSLANIIKATISSLRYIVNYIVSANVLFHILLKI
uniref:Uncharacterized protein n=1 Tax=Periophthalmus magnuspinnatus TaxID=409849 RepID=A0A3B3ZNX3_9GOBI